MESLYSNQIWFLVRPLDGVKFIGYKCVYKRKRMIGENLSGKANGNGVTPRKKVFNTFQPIVNNLSRFSHPLYLIGTEI